MIKLCDRELLKPGGPGEWAHLKRVLKPRAIPYLLLTSQPYFLAVSTGNLF